MKGLVGVLGLSLCSLFAASLRAEPASEVSDDVAQPHACSSPAGASCYNMNVYCRCTPLGFNGGVNRLDRIVNGRLPETIAYNLTPDQCVQALRYPPCVVCG